jgi:transcriptional regulator with XRE-family HTH domain
LGIGHLQSSAPAEVASLSCLGDIERGDPTPSLTTVPAITQALGIDPWSLFRRPDAGAPADMVECIGANDGRPVLEEAWSIALRSVDEAETVGWTAEIAAAHCAEICAPTAATAATVYTARRT